MNGLPDQILGAPRMQRVAPQIRTRNPFYYMSGSIAAAQKRRQQAIRAPAPRLPIRPM